jgi:hypothetical protein
MFTKKKLSSNNGKNIGIATWANPIAETMRITRSVSRLPNAFVR